MTGRLRMSDRVTRNMFISLWPLSRLTEYGEWDRVCKVGSVGAYCVSVETCVFATEMLKAVYNRNLLSLHF